MNRITDVMDQIIDIVLMNIEVKTARTIIRVACGVFLLIVCIWLIVFIYNRLSSQNELHRWKETSAVVTESVTTGESLSNLMSRYVGNDNTEWYKTYTVWYKVDAEGFAWGVPYNFKYSSSITGEESEWAFEVPSRAYYAIPKEGDVISLVYDPDEIGTFKVGTIKELDKQIKAANSSIMVPIIFILLTSVLILFDFRIKKAGQE